MEKTIRFYDKDLLISTVCTQRNNLNGRQMWWAEDSPAMYHGRLSDVKAIFESIEKNCMVLLPSEIDTLSKYLKDIVLMDDHSRIVSFSRRFASYNGFRKFAESLDWTGDHHMDHIEELLQRG